MVAIEGSKLLIGYVGPRGSHPAKTLHPAFAILPFKASRLPNHEQAIARKESFDFVHKDLLLRRAKMMERLPNPGYIQWTGPSVDRIDKVEAAEVHRTVKSRKRLLRDIE